VREPINLVPTRLDTKASTNITLFDKKWLHASMDNDPIVTVDL